MSNATTFSHVDIDRRIRNLVEACVLKIDHDPGLLQRAREQMTRWTNVSMRLEWERLLALPWPDLRTLLLEESERGDRIRQSVPFGGFLGNEERMRILKSS
jgi:hypothetical protein